MKARTTVQKWKVRGQTRWAVHRVEGGKRRRSFFESRRAAESEAVMLRTQQAATGEIWLALPATERQRLLQAHQEARQLGVDLAELLAEWKCRPQQMGSGPALEDVISELVESKAASGRSPRYAKSLGLILGQFARGRERQAIAELGVANIEGF